MNLQAATPLALNPRPREENPAVPDQTFSWRRALLLAAGAAGTFHLAYTFPALAFLIVAFLFFLFELAALPSQRQAFYFGFTMGGAVYVPHLAFFWSIFGWPAMALWTVPAFWLGLRSQRAKKLRLAFHSASAVCNN